MTRQNPIEGLLGSSFPPLRLTHGAPILRSQESLGSRCNGHALPFTFLRNRWSLLSFDIKRREVETRGRERGGQSSHRGYQVFSPTHQTTPGPCDRPHTQDPDSYPQNPPNIIGANRGGDQILPGSLRSFGISRRAHVIFK